MGWFWYAVLMAIVLKWAAQLYLERINQAHVRSHAGAVPEAFREVIDAPTYRKAVDYTLAKGRLAQVEQTFGAVILMLVLFSGCLGWCYHSFLQRFGTSVWAQGGFLFLVGTVLSLSGLPLDWYSQFRLEERFGFNTTTQATWWIDRIKGLMLALVLGLPLLVLILKLVQWTGRWWWLWAWAAMTAFQLLLTVLAPVLILPLFNKFQPLSPGTLRERLLGLAERARFKAQSIQVMDGSKRSRHSNAFFIGFGKLRKIVLFDTLISQLDEPELEAVLAHEIGHYKLGHIPKTLAVSGLFSLLGFFVLSLLAAQPWFNGSFGLPAAVAPSLLLFGLLSGLVTFWFGPVTHWWSRRHEYEADAYAAGLMRETRSLVGALRKLNEKNLSNLTPHPWFSGFYYSHPTLLEREQGLQSHGA